MSEPPWWLRRYLLAALLVVLSRPAAGQSRDPAEALRALKSVRVLVFADDLLIAAGLDTGALRTSVEVELRRDGVPVVDDQPSALYEVKVSGLETRNRGGAATGFVYTVRTELYQAVRVPGVETFSGGGYIWFAAELLGTGGDINGVSEPVRSDAREDAEKFANDWLKVHTPAAP